MVLRFIFLDLFLFESQLYIENERQRGDGILSAGVLPKWLQQLTRESGASSGRAGQGPEDLGHPLLISQAISREPDQKWSG